MQALLGSHQPLQSGSLVRPMIQAGRSALDRLLMPADRTQLDSVPGPGEATWLAAESWRVLARPRIENWRGQEIERFALPSGETVSAVYDADLGSVRVPFDLDEAYTNFVNEAWRPSVDMRSLSPRQLQVYYSFKRFIPCSWRLASRRLFMRWTGLPAFPSWPLDDSVHQLVRFYANCLLVAACASESRFRWFWPGDHRAALILTHDVESAAGLRLAVELADIEESLGLRSSFNIVGGDYPIDEGVVRELSERGFEVGLHGLHHDRSLFSSRAEFERQLPALSDVARKLGAEGFRSPSTHRVVGWLEELPVSYDCSLAHSDPFEPQPGGCCSLWPFFLGDLVELPYTLPQDHTLFTLLRSRSVEPWLAQVDSIEARFGLIQSLTHPDPGYLGDRDKRALYLEFLEAVCARETLWKPLPRELAAWWRRRDSADAFDPEFSLGTMRRDGAEPYAWLEPPARMGLTGRQRELSEDPEEQ